MEFLKNLMTPVTERVRSPFYGAFFISWLLVNWRIVLAFFGDEKIIDGLEKVKFISNELTNTQRSICYPLLYTILYLFIIPWAEYFTSWYSEFVKRKKVEKKLEVLKKFPVSGEEYVQLYNRFLAKEDSLAKLESDLNNRISEVGVKENEISKMKDDIINLQDQIREKNSLITKYQNRKKLTTVFEGQWEHAWRKNNEENFKEKYVLEVNSSNTQFLINEGGQLKTIDYISHVDIDPEFHQINFLTSKSGKFGLAGDTIFVSLRRDSDNPNRYIGLEKRPNGETPEVYFEKVLKK